jgi:CheY-like chemotaxis protein
MSATDTILLVEDNTTDVLLVRRALTRAGITNPIAIAADGDSAVNYLAGSGEYADRERHPLPALVLLDLKLPRRSGLEVLAWLRAQPDLRRTPVVVLTSSQQRPDVNRAYDLGANSYLVKPVEFDELQRMLDDVNAYWMSLNTRPTVTSVQ